MRKFILTICFWIIASSAIATRYWVGPVPWVAASGNFPAHYEAPTGVTSWIDLRTTSECGTAGIVASGVAIFVTADATNLSASYINLGTDIERVLTNPQRNALAIALRMQSIPSSNILADIIYESLTSQADPTGVARVTPIVPTNNLRYEVWLGGQKIRDKPFDANGPEWPNLQIQLRAEYAAARIAVQNGQLPANFHRKILGYWVRKYHLPYRQFQNASDPDESDLPPSTTVTDSFTRADGAIGGSWTAVSGTWTIASNGAGKTASASVNGFARYESNLSSSDQYAQVKLTNSGAALAHGPACRFSSSALTAYFTYNYLGTNYLTKEVAGTDTAIATVSYTLVANDIYKVEANGTTIKSYINGVQKNSVTDSSISGNLRGGLYQYGIASPTVDDFQAADLSAPSGLTYKAIGSSGSFVGPGGFVGN